VGLCLLSSGCGAGETCDAEVAMRDFLLDEDNQTCSEDHDCVVVNVNPCGEASDVAYCGQVELSAAASATSTWRTILRETRECEQSCVQCLGVLFPTCYEGRCHTP